MRKVTTVCTRDCYDTCSLVVTLAGSGKPVAVKGHPDHLMTRGFTCPRGAKDHERLFKNRVEAPLLRVGNSLEKINWDQALEVVAQKLTDVLENHGPEAVLYLAYAGNIGLLTEVYPQRLWNGIGATQTDWAICSKSGHKGLALHYGDSYGITATELPDKDLLVFWGFNAVASSPHMWALAREARRSNSAQIIAVDPRRSRTAKAADLWIQPRPGTDIALVYGLVNYLIRQRHIDQEFIAEWTRGFERLEEKASQWTPERVKQVTGVAWKDVERLGEAYANRKHSATMIGIGLQKCDQGADQVRAVSLIPALLGQHRGFYYANSYPIDKSLISGKALTDKVPGEVSQVACGELVSEGRFKFLYISGMNPCLTIPNQRAFREGLSRPDVFVVVHETHWTETARRADIILPAPTYLEKDDLVIPWSHNYVRLSARVVPPVTDSRSEAWLVQRFARKLGLVHDWLYEDPWVSVERALDGALVGGDFKAMMSGEMLRLKLKKSQGYSTPSGKIEFYSSSAKEMGLEGLPTQTPLDVGDGQFILLASAVPRHTSTQFREVYGPIPAEVTVNPCDADRLGIEDGAAVILANDRGQLQVRAVISDAVPVGVLWSPRQIEGLEGVPQNCLTSSEPQVIGGGPRFNSTAVALICPES